MDSLTLINISITVVVYLGAKWLSERLVSPLTTPVLTASLLIIVILSVFDISYEQYSEAKEWISILLGPATVALAVPMYHNRTVIMEKMIPALFGLMIGTISTIVSAVWLSKVFGLSEAIQAAAAVKAVTTPVAIDVVLIINGDPALASAFVVIAGIVGAVLAPTLLSILKIKDPFSRGLGIGAVSHVIGTSQAVKEGPLEGAVSSMALSLAAIFTTLILPWLYPVIQM
ncbi:LrgB family protein [Niallia sp. XMNu-256]|uniref:LrgB family protein n=1 Tax=Niallia sp. XMNu-256 TaxID=3082444 RepID=UPI0030D06D72